jgi:hypothetical protein
MIDIGTDKDYLADVAYVRKAMELDTRPIPNPDELLTDSQKYMEELLWIKPKRGPVCPLRLNRVQLKAKQLKAEGRRRGFRKFIYLKARREGITTYEQAESYHMVATQPDKVAVTIAHRGEDTAKIFRMVSLFYDTSPEWARPYRKGVGNKYALEFPNLRSIFEIGTAGAGGYGRGTQNDKTHGTEVAYWPGSLDDQENLHVGLIESCSGEVVYESTANGFGNLFEQTWTSAVKKQNEWWPMFFAWFEDPTYRLHLTAKARQQVASTYTDYELKLVLKHHLSPEQIAWYRLKKRDLGIKMQQEHPSSPEEAFLATGICFFDTGIINNLLLGLADYSDKMIQVPGGIYVEWEAPIPGEEYVLGADTSEGVLGGDPNGYGIMRRSNGLQVASLHGWFTPRVLAEKIRDAHVRYPGLFIGVERNNHGHAVLLELENLVPEFGQPHYLGGDLYYHSSSAGSHSRMPSGKPGWDTNGQTRPVLLDGLSDALLTGSLLVNDRLMLDECLRFKKQANGKFECKSPDHDDSIFKWGIAYQMLNHRPNKPVMDFIEAL